jgi:UDP-N-acetylmuramoyl-tripeptide--D-alanyl-D-alanine ligase
LILLFYGDNFDAHDYVKQAQKMGAVALLVSKKVKSSLPTLVVENTQDALSKIHYFVCSIFIVFSIFS